MVGARGGRGVSLHACRRREASGGAVLRTQQGPLRSPRFPRPADRSLRHLLLPRRRRSDAPCRADGGALVHALLAACCTTRSRGGRRSCCTPAIRISHRPTSRRRSPTEGTGGLTERTQVAHRDAVCRRPWRDRSRARSRDRARVSDRHREARGAGRLRPARLVHRRAWPSTSRSVRRPHTRRCGCATPPRTTGCRPSSSSTIRDIFPYRYGHALWSYLAGALRRRHPRPGAAIEGARGARRDSRGDRTRRRASCIDDWHDSISDAADAAGRALQLPRIESRRSIAMAHGCISRRRSARTGDS